VWFYEVERTPGRKAADLNTVVRSEDGARLLDGSPDTIIFDVGRESEDRDVVTSGDRASSPDP
jgi:hypothetical protein